MLATCACFETKEKVPEASPHGKEVCFLLHRVVSLSYLLKGEATKFEATVLGKRVQLTCILRRNKCQLPQSRNVAVH
jgi:hypothetical protein